MYRSFRLYVLTTMLWSILIVASGEESERTNFATVHNSNAAILNRLGLVPVRIPEGHHKKRLAGPEPSGLVSASSQTRIHQPYSRRHGHRDSHVYVVKLPASQPYYTLTKPHKPSSLHEQDKITKTTRITGDGSGPQVGFHGNGKPAKIYHWNLPIVKKMTEKKRLHSQLRIEQMRKKLEAEMNEQQQQQHHMRIHEEAEDKTNAMLADTAVRPATISRTRNPIGLDVKRYHHFGSGNSLSQQDKPFKHTRNNDKRLNYPRISVDHRKSARPENTLKIVRKNNNTTSNKMYRIEDSNLYRLGVGASDRHSNDRLAGWKLSNELHASRNTPNGPKAKKHRKKAAMSYYAPINSSKIDDTNSIHKNFPGNGKPKGFYVIEKSRQPVYYHPLLP